MVGHTVMYSSVLNLHQPKKTLPVKGEGKFVLPVKIVTTSYSVACC